MKGVVAQDPQVVGIFEQRGGHFPIPMSRRSQHPLVNHLLRGSGQVEPHAEQFGPPTDHHPTILRTSHGSAFTPLGVGAQGDGGTVDQTDPIVGVDQHGRQSALDGFNHPQQGASPSVEARVIQETGEEVSMVLADEGQTKLLIAMEEGLGDQGDGDHLAVGEIRFRASLTQAARLSADGLIGIIHQDIPGDENVLPTAFCEIIGQAGYASPPLILIGYNRGCT